LWRLGHPSEGTGTPIPEAAPWADRLSADVDQGVELLGRLMERCLEAAGHIEQNVGVSLCLEALCTDLSVAARAPSSAR
jgi:hypothetical protein